MERALDPRLLNAAIAGRVGLPSPEELARLLAETELRLLIGAPAIDEALVATGWYLHAVAASRWATERYGAEHRRAAFRVAGHTLDLALQSQELELLERVRFCFAAQAAYVRSGLDPNAIAIYRREAVGTFDNLQFVRDAHTVALACGAAVLGMDLGRVMKNARVLIDRSRLLADRWGVESITNTVFGAAALVAYGANDLAVYLAYGWRRRLESAAEAFRRAVDSEAAAGDRTSRWVASHLLEIADHLGNASLWSILPPDVPDEVRRAFTAGQPRIVTLWPPQAEFFPRSGGDLRTPLDPSVKRLFLATPTSGGKTLLAQLMVATHVARGLSSVCYVAPTRSLCHEVRSDLDRRVRALRTNVLDDLPTWLPVSPEAAQSAVEVMTPERLSYLLRSDPEGVLARFGLFIFDEVHNIGEAGRGWTLEASLSYLHHATQGNHHRIVLVSAVAGNQAHFIEWLGGDSPEVLHRYSNWRAPRRLHALWTTRVDWDAGELLPSLSGRSLPRARFPIMGQLHVRADGTNDVRRLAFSEPVGHLVMRETKQGKSVKDTSASTSAYRCMVPLIHHLASGGPTLVIESTRAATTRLAQAVADSRPELPLPPAPQGLIDLVHARLGMEHPLSSTLKAGVAFHHGSLPAEVRTGIEEAVSDGTLSCLVATTTMTEGVNLPVRAVVIASQGTYGDGGTYREYITGSKLINAIGRAGRAAKETEGVIVLARPTGFAASDFDRIDPEQVDTTVLSTLATSEALEELAEFEQLLAEGQDAVLLASGRAVNGFLSFVWFVASCQEDLTGAVTVEEMDLALSRTFAWVQLDETAKARWRAAAGEGILRFNETPVASRRKWARAGTSLASARMMEAVAAEIIEALRDGPVPTRVSDTIGLMFGDGRLERLQKLREAPDLRIYTARGGGRVELPVDLRAVLADWLGAAELKYIADTHFIGVRDIDYRFEQLGDYLNEYFETFLPWVLATLIGWVNDGHAEGFDAWELSTDTPAYVRWGVNHPIALHVMNEGVRSRILASAVALACPFEAGTGDVRSWLGSLGVAGWQRMFEASVADLRNLLDYARPKDSGVLADLLGGRSVEIPFTPEWALTEAAGAELQSHGASALDPVEVYVGGVRIGTVPARHQVDLRTVLDVVLPFEVQVLPSNDGVLLRVTPLLDEDAAQVEI